MKSNIFPPRRKKIQSLLLDHQAILISSPADIFYLTGFQFLVPQEREALLVIAKKNIYFLYPSFSVIPTDSDLTLLSSPHFNKLTDHFAIINKKNNLKELLLDPQSLFLIEFQQLEKLDLKLISQPSSMVLSQRIIKDNYEIMQIEKACQISKNVSNRIIKLLKNGITEIELKQSIEEQFKLLGATEISFPTIVAFGANTALPHHQPTNKKLKSNTPILIDMGAKVDGYCSDMTRTFWFDGQPDPQFEKISDSVQRAYQQAIKIINKTLKSKDKLTAAQIDQASRSVIENDGFGPYFIHTTGHGLGIDIHESPSINWRNSQEIKNGMIITIEPGIYLDDKFGCRFENTISIRDNKVVELT